MQVQTPVEETKPVENGEIVETVFTKEQRQRRSELVKAGRLVMSAQGGLLEKYFLLLLLIREKHYNPREVDFCLTQIGFHKVRIAEIKRVAFTSDEVFNAYRERVIGFKAALAASRKQGAKATDELRWNRTFSRIDQLAGKCRPTQDFYEGNEWCVFLFDRGAFNGDSKTREKTFTVKGWRLTVTRCQRKRAAKIKPHEKSRSTKTHRER